MRLLGTRERAITVAREEAATSGRRQAVIHMVGTFLWKVVPSGGSEHQQYRAFRDEQRTLQQTVVRRGLCANRADHAPHHVRESTLGSYWCAAEQNRRQPAAGERWQRERRNS